jgi:hypothetical protein
LATGDGDLLVGEEINQRTDSGPGDNGNKKQGSKEREADAVPLLGLEVNFQGLGERVDFAYDRINAFHFINY